MAGVEQQVDLAPLAAAELVDRRRRDGRLAKALDLLGLLAAAVVTQLARQPVALGDELARFQRVEPVELALEAGHELMLMGRYASLVTPIHQGARMRTASLIQMAFLTTSEGLTLASTNAQLGDPGTCRRR